MTGRTKPGPGQLCTYTPCSRFKPKLQVRASKGSWVTEPLFVPFPNVATFIKSDCHNNLVKWPNVAKLSPCSQGNLRVCKGAAPRCPLLQSELNLYLVKKGKKAAGSLASTQAEVPSPPRRGIGKSFSPLNSSTSGLSNAQRTENP